MSHNLKGIQPHELEVIWPEWWPLLALSEEYNAGVPIEEEKTFMAILKGEVQAWACMNGDLIELAFTTTMYNTPVGKTLEIVAIGGKNVKDWLWVIDKLAEWGADYDCKRLLASGRKGWSRVLQGVGFETVAYVNERAI